MDIIALADEYRAAAGLLFQRARVGEPLSRAPARLCSIHAIELYLNAFLRHEGETPEKIRSYLHDLSERADPEVVGKLRLRKRTVSHLVGMSEKREYLIARYGPELASTHSEINRLLATLDEIASKVKKAVI
ncbi:hypothetical protein [Actibacterium sp. MT2.3-13A]|uniref:hypothetical protein n=1 Tax=Actibacterium sp. MT2.3-13A TaxID=2828332 RepID=UPI001BA81600|nr:hypothetical protein [Actibacterium sp. MT2.3-13A]